jgi:hypothetical protein
MIFLCLPTKASNEVTAEAHTCHTQQRTKDNRVLLLTFKRNIWYYGVEGGKAIARPSPGLLSLIQENSHYRARAEGLPAHHFLATAIS